jgi:hypothetical protein
VDFSSAVKIMHMAEACAYSLAAESLRRAWAVADFLLLDKASWTTGAVHDARWLAATDAIGTGSLANVRHSYAM